ncbi:MAG: hypothetical protein WBF06_09810 [Candidatus Acidiferrales bacterium]
MRVPDAIVDRVPQLGVLTEDWEPVSRGAAIGWLVFYAVMLLSVATNGTLKNLMDLVFVPIHEGGHLLFRFFGEWIMVAGGTFLQLFVPFALAVYFILRRQVPGTAFCAFFFFEQFLPIAIYMADSHCQCLTYVTVGDSDTAIHDWFYLFSSVGLLEHDTQIAALVRTLGWIGMLATVIWFAVRSLRSGEIAAVPAAQTE